MSVRSFCNAESARFPENRRYSVDFHGTMWDHHRQKQLKATMTHPKGYLFVTLPNGDGTRKCWFIHHVVAITFIEPADDMHDVIDHADNVKTNNHIDNLRWCTGSQQNANRSVGRKRKEDLPRGVSRTKNGTKFAVRITHNYVDKHLGMFDTVEEADAVAKAKRREFFGEFARDV